MDFDVNAVQAVANQYDVTLDEVVTTLEKALTDAYAKAHGGGAHAKIDTKSNQLLIVDDETNADVTPDDLGRMAAGVVRQAVTMWAKNKEKNKKLGKWAHRERTLVQGTVKAHAARNQKGETIVDLGGNVEGVLLPGEKTEGEDFAHGERATFFVLDVNPDDRGRVKVSLSRRQPLFVGALFESVVPELKRGEIEIRNIVREPGVRSKVAVASNKPGLDGRAALIGPTATRIKQVAEILGRKEHIDVVQVAGDVATFAANALTPARGVKAHYDEERRVVVATAPADQVLIARGENGRNAKMAAKLVGVRSIEVVSA